MNYFSNINTYLSYAVTRLTTSNYNEIDALVFSQLSYYPFEQIVSDFERCQISVSEFANLVMHQQDFSNLYSQDKQIFISKLAQSKRYANCIIRHMRAEKEENIQWAAFTVDINSAGTAVIAMRGTDGTTIGWAENFRLAYQVIGTGAQLESFRYLKNITAKRIYLTGHSKGGSNVCSAYVMSNAYIRDKIVRIDNFDGPGVNPEFAANYADGYEELESKLNNFYPGDSIIGQLLQDNPGKSFYIQTKVRDVYAHKPISGQHDPFAFLVKGDKFLKTKQTELSKGINDIVDGLVNKTTNIQRYYLIQFVQRIGIPALISGDEGGAVAAVAHFVCGVIQTPPEEKKILFQVICSFIKNLIRQGKEWIAQHWAKGYNKSNVIQATI